MLCFRAGAVDPDRHEARARLAVAQTLVDPYHDRRVAIHDLTAILTAAD